MTYEEIRDKYLDILYRLRDKYSLTEDEFNDLVVCYCEFIHKWFPAGRVDWREGIYRHCKRYVMKLLDERQSTAHHSSDVLEGLVHYDDYVLHDYTPLLEAIKTLPPREREILRYRFVEGMSCAECAELFHISRAYVSQIATKTRHRLVMRNWNLYEYYVSNHYRRAKKRSLDLSKVFYYATEKELIPYPTSNDIIIKRVPNHNLFVICREGKYLTEEGTWGKLSEANVYVGILAVREALTFV